MNYLEFGKGKLGVRSWCEVLDEGTRTQLAKIVELPFLAGPPALMPDAHIGYGVPIGTVLRTLDVIIPNAVGVDIGCGMRYAKTNLEVGNLTKDQLAAILGEIRNVIPVGFKKRTTPEFSLTLAEVPKGDLTKEMDDARYSMGTLGGGNHFIELQETPTGHLAVMIHSGSRHLGLSIAKTYHEKAKLLNVAWGSKVDPSLAFLPLGSKEADEYLYQYRIAVRFAKENREVMMRYVGLAIKIVLGDVEFSPAYDIAHNYLEVEDGIVTHRKGAISAKEAEVGIIPGSQGTPSYLTMGRGRAEAYNSSSHGAGRTLGRGQAKERLNLEEEQGKMEGILHSVRGQGDLDEAPGAYKNIDDVMEAQKDLTWPVVKLRPLGVVKG